ncbi:MAG: radical SAM protein, partial [Anaerolineaceae bacterium]|nr:radical SAM protein [Anaerolineaceae bacterium]
PTRIIVPSIDVVHNRVAIEIMRGCTRGCRFCHAGMVTRPVRERPVNEIIEAIQESLNHTGFEEIALLSLSSSDYTKISKLVEILMQNFSDQNLRISLPSLRIESFSIDLMEKLKGSKPGGFTLAPEAATNRMREIINKPVQTEQLLDTAREIYKRGWLSIKLYFMIGHPDETLDDVKAIAGLCKAVINEGRKIVGGRAKLNVGVSTFVPKPHTPFQWVPCDTLDKINVKQKILQKELRVPGIKFKWTDPRETLFEAMLSRGDRRLGKVILDAWKKGAKFDAWQEKFNFKAWELSLQENGIDPEFYTHRERPTNEVFPWDHINTGVRKEFLVNDFMKSFEGETRLDCRHNCFACGILSTFSEKRSQNPGSKWECPEIKVDPE